MEQQEVRRPGQTGELDPGPEGALQGVRRRREDPGRGRAAGDAHLFQRQPQPREALDQGHGLQPPGPALPEDGLHRGQEVGASRAHC